MTTPELIRDLRDRKKLIEDNLSVAYRTGIEEFVKSFNGVTVIDFTELAHESPGKTPDSRKVFLRNGVLIAFSLSDGVVCVIEELNRNGDTEPIALTALESEDLANLYEYVTELQTEASAKMLMFAISPEKVIIRRLGEKPADGPRTRKELFDAFVALIQEYGDKGARGAETVDISSICDEYIALADAPIEKISWDGNEMRIYYAACSEESYDYFGEFDFSELRDFYLRLKKVLDGQE